MNRDKHEVLQDVLIHAFLAHLDVLFQFDKVARHLCLSALRIISALHLLHMSTLWTVLRRAVRGGKPA